MYDSCMCSCLWLAGVLSLAFQVAISRPKSPFASSPSNNLFMKLPRTSGRHCCVKKPQPRTVAFHEIHGPKPSVASSPSNDLFMKLPRNSGHCWCVKRPHHFRPRTAVFHEIHCQSNSSSASSPFHCFVHEIAQDFKVCFLSYSDSS
jgi:hypothetical protein